MKIEIPDLKVLYKDNLDPNSYTYLYCLYHYAYEDWWYSRIDEARIKDLQMMGWIKIVEDGTVKLRERAVLLFELDSEERCWIELFLAFPMKVDSRTGGSRPLRASNLDAKSNELPKKKYLSIIKNKPELHKHIIKVLEAEVEMRRNSSTLQFMNALEVWINQKNWEKYEYLLKEKEEKSGEEGYGGKLI